MSNSRLQKIAREYAGKQCYIGQTPADQKINFKRAVNAFIAGHRVGLQEGLNLRSFYIAELDRLELAAKSVQAQIYRLDGKEG